jgi:hypothetical protein
MDGAPSSSGSKRGLLERAGVALLAAAGPMVGCSGDGSATAPTTRPLVSSVLANEAVAAPGVADNGSVTGALNDDPMGTGLTGVELEAFLASRYEAYWEAFDEARSLPGAEVPPDRPAVESLAAGEQLEVSHLALADLAARREVVVEADQPAIADTDTDTEHRVGVLSVDGAEAQLEVCMVNDDIRVSVIDGSVVSDEVFTVESLATMVRTDEGWKLVRSRAIDRTEGVGGCWLGGGGRFPY